MSAAEWPAGAQERCCERFELDPHELARRVALQGDSGALCAALADAVGELLPGESIGLSIVGAEGSYPMPRVSVRAEVSAHEGERPSLEALSARLQAALALPAGGYLRAAAADVDPARGACSFALEPQGVRVVPATSQAIGFTAIRACAPATSDAGQRGVLMPLLGADHVRPGSAYAALLTGRDATIDVVFGSRALDQFANRYLQELLRAIESGQAVAARMHDDNPIPPAVVERLRSEWVELLIRTMASGRVLTTAAVVARPGRDAHEALALARLVWPGCDARRGGAQTSSGLDLRTGSVLPLLARVLPGPQPPRLRVGLRPRAVVEPPKGLAIGLGHDGANTISLNDAALSRHVHIVGATGTGKSTLMRSMIRQQMEAGCGLGILDPHGELVADAIADLPESRHRDVVLFDPTDTLRSPGLNHFEPIAGAASLDASALANELIDMFGQMYDLDRAGGPVFEQYFRSAIQLLLSNAMTGMTLCEVPLVFESTDFRRSLMAQCTSAETASFWSRQAEPATGDLSMSAMAPYITSKLHQFTHNPKVRAIIGQSRSTVDLASLMDGRGILLANLSRGALGLRESSLIGMLLMSRLFRIAMARTSRPRDRRTPFTVYIDEVQTCLSEHVAAALSEARKVGLRLVLAHQHLSQIDRGRPGHNLLETVLANAGTMLAFRLGADDARRLERLLGPTIAADDLVGLPDFSAAIRWEGPRGVPCARIIDTGGPHSASPRRSTAALHPEQIGRGSRPRTEVERELVTRRERCLSASGTGAVN